MEPSIHTGSVVMIAPSALYKQNDIITFQDLTDKKKTITHRIKDLEVVEGNIYYITKGDANDSADARKVAQKEVIGKVVFSVPLVGYLIEAVRKPLGLFIIILIPALAIFFDEGRKIVREIKKIRTSDKSENLDERK
jgi:signal peptidase